MSDTSKNNGIFKKRENQLKKILQKKKDEELNQDNESINSDQLNKDEIIDLNLSDSNSDINNINTSDNLENKEDLVNIDLTDSNLEDEEDLVNIDLTDSNLEDEEDLVNIDLTDSSLKDEEDLVNMDLTDSNLEDEEDFLNEENLMDDLIGHADELIENIDNENRNNNISDKDVFYDDDSINVDTEINDEINENENESFTAEDGSYSDEEIEQKRKIKNTKNLIIRIGIGFVSILIIILLAFGLKKFMNYVQTNKFPIKKEKQINTNETVIEETIESTKDVSAKDDLLNNYETEKESTATESESIESESSEENVSMFIQNYKGYVMDIKEDSIIISDLNYDKVKVLNEDFQNYMGDFQKIVYINVKNEVNETQSEDPNNESQETTIPIDSNINYNLFHLENSTELTENKKSMTLKDALSQGFEPDEQCKKELNLNVDASPKKYDYSLNESLKNVIFKKFMLDEKTTLPEWITIGSEVNVTFIQNKESLINELIEINKFESIEDTKDQKTNENSETTNNETETTVANNEGTNVWGENWTGVVAQINDRRKKEEDKKNEENPLNLQNLSLKESLETVISIGKASIVWFRVGFKQTQTQYFPDLNDIAVELQTSNGSLINDSNISKYGKKWVSDDGTINFVIKNTIAGDWKVLFTKNIGTYLGNIKIEAVPITGFLQIVDASAIYTDGKLKVIWNVGGVSDDNCKVQIYAKNGNKDILLYSGNTIDDGIHTIDMVDIDTKKIAGTTYDIYIKITDIDVSPTEPKVITATYITDTKTIEKVEIPKLSQ